MAEFEVKVVQIDNVKRHPDADTLSIVSIGGYECISGDTDDGQQRYNTGDYVVYIPEQAVLPQWLLERLNLWDSEKNKGRLKGSGGNRLGAIRLRGVFSQGLLYPVYKDSESVLKMTVDIGSVEFVTEGQDVAELLGITKYEPVIPAAMAGQAQSLQGYTKSYDIENLQKYSKVFTEDDQIVATEKLHGTCCIFTITKDAPKDKQHELWPLLFDQHAFVTSKGLAKQGLIQKNTEENQFNLYVKTAQKTFIDSGVSAEIQLGNNVKQLHFFGEIVGKGIQDLDYDSVTPEFILFDVCWVFDDGKHQYLNFQQLTQLANHLGLKQAAVIYMGPFNLEELTKHRDGKTTYGGKHIREGLVIKPLLESEYRGLPENRKQLKFVSPDYLLRKSGTEYN